LHLQQILGNQAVQRLLESSTIQAKLTISQPNDIYEQEADRVADQVMQMPEKGADVDKIDSRSLITQSEIRNPQSAIELKPA